MLHILQAIVSKFIPLKLHCPHMIEDRCEFFPSDSAQIPPPVIVTNAADSSKVHNRSSNLETIDTEDKAGSEVGEEKRKEVPRIVRKHRQHTCPPSGTRPFLFPL